MLVGVGRLATLEELSNTTEVCTLVDGVRIVTSVLWGVVAAALVLLSVDAVVLDMVAVGSARAVTPGIVLAGQPQADIDASEAQSCADNLFDCTASAPTALRSPILSSNGTASPVFRTRPHTSVATGKAQSM